MRIYPGAQFDRYESNATTYTAGVMAFGIQLSSRTGYSSMFHIYFQAGQGDDYHYLFCRYGHPSTAKCMYSY